MTVTMTRQRSHSSASAQHHEPKSKDDLWEGALEKTIGGGDSDGGGGAVVQMIGMDSTHHIVYARVVSAPSPSDAAPAAEDKKDAPTSTPPPQVTIGAAVEATVDEEWSHAVKNILEKKEHINNDSRPPPAELFRLGAVWLVNETEYAKGNDAHAHRLTCADVSRIPCWTDMTLRVHYVPDRYHAANEVDWAKYCRGLLVGGNVEVSVGGEKPHVPIKGLPDSKDGAIVYEDEKLGYAILNKPEGVPGHGSKSNHIENVVVLFHEALKELWPEQHRKIHVTTPRRIDSEVQGLVAVSTRKEFAPYLIDQPVSRKYRCLVCIKDDGASLDKLERLVQSGTVVTHHVDAKCNNPKKKFVRNQPKSAHGHDWSECKMRITRVGFGEGGQASRELRAASVSSQYDDANLQPDVTLAHRLWRPDSADNPAEHLGVKFVMQLEIEDLTGHPHQLRGQLAALGVPIVGDGIYGGGTCVTGAHRHTWKRMALQCFEVSFLEPQREEEEAEGGKGEEEEGEGGGDHDEKKKKGGEGRGFVPSERECVFRLKDAWWTSYLEEYARSV